MPIHKTAAVVLNTYPYSDGSLVAHLVTRRFGRLSVIAKGARRPKTRLYTQLDRLYVLEVVIYFKAGRSMQTLSDADLVAYHPELRTSLVRFYAAQYASELVATGITEDHPNVALYDRFVLGLEECSRLPEERLPLWVLHFEAGVLEALGLSPAVDRCIACGRPNPYRGAATFSLAAGGLLCRACQDRGPVPRPTLELSAPALKTWRALATPAGTTEARRLLEDAELPRTALLELRRLLDRFLPYHLERQLRLSKHLPR